MTKEDLDFYNHEFMRLGYSTMGMAVEDVDKWILLLQEKIDELEGKK